jgi:Flp pilus assembly protein TadG
LIREDLVKKMIRTNKIHPSSSHSPAQALVEFALILPILLLLIIAAMDFGRMYYTKIVLTDAAREGASYYATSAVCKTSCTWSDCSTGLKAVVVEAGASSGVQVVNSEITLPTTCGTPGSSGSVNVTKSVTFMLQSFLKKVGLVNGALSLSSTVTMVVQ